MLKKYLRFASPENLDNTDMFSKVRPMTDMLLESCEDTFEVGENVSLDEIDINVQASFKGKDRIKNKRDGDGVLNDAVCTSVEGALLTFRYALSILRFMVALKN